MNKLAVVFGGTRGIGEATVKTLASQGWDIVGNTPEEGAARLRSEIERWTKVVREAGVKPD